MHADRRKLMMWSVGSAFVLGLGREAHGQTPAAQAGASSPPKADPNDPLQPRTPMKHAFVDNVVMLAELTVKPEMLDAFLAYTTANLELSRSARGNLAFDILLNEAQPDRVIFYEVWQSSKAQQDYMAWRVQAGDLTKLLTFLAGEPKFTRLRSIAA